MDFSVDALSVCPLCQAQRWEWVKRELCLSSKACLFLSLAFPCCVVTTNKYHRLYFPWWPFSNEKSSNLGLEIALGIHFLCASFFAHHQTTTGVSMTWKSLTWFNIWEMLWWTETSLTRYFGFGLNNAIRFNLLLQTLASNFYHNQEVSQSFLDISWSMAKYTEALRKSVTLYIKFLKG